MEDFIHSSLIIEVDVDIKIAELIFVLKSLKNIFFSITLQSGTNIRSWIDSESTNEILVAREWYLPIARLPLIKLKRTLWCNKL